MLIGGNKHNHDKDHSHSHESPASLKNLIFAIVINGGIVVFEMVFGLVIQSMALIEEIKKEENKREHRSTFQELPISAKRKYGQAAGLSPLRR